MEELTIGEVARRTGLRPSALRYYESVGILSPPRRVYGGHRRYDASIFSSLTVIHMARQAGFTIAEIRQLVSGFATEVPASERWQVLAQQKRQEVEKIIAEAQETKKRLECLLQCPCSQFTECAQACSEQGIC